jgi:tRNA1(Val) A37 N6-methylase TrmN6
MTAEDATTVDVFLGGRFTAEQPRQGFRSGLDSVLLAAAVPVGEGAEIVLDCGAGVGVVGLAIAARCPRARVLFVEREADLACLARANVERNGGLAERLAVIEADIGLPARELARLGVGAASVDHAVANPPYFEEGAGVAARVAGRARARAMPAGELERWSRFLARVVRPGGSLTMIHRTAALAEVLAALAGRFGAVRVRPLLSTPGSDAKRFILQARKGSRAPLALASPLIVHEPAGGYSATVEQVLREAAALPV